MRASGILLPISSIPSPHGIGCFDRNAYRFVDTLVSCGQKYWQILPMGPTGYGDSPYQSFSTFAGNPYYISLDALAEEGLLTAEEIAAADLEDEGNYYVGRVFDEKEIKKGYTNYLIFIKYAKILEDKGG